EDDYDDESEEEVDEYYDFSSDAEHVSDEEMEEEEMYIDEEEVPERLSSPTPDEQSPPVLDDGLTTPERDENRWEIVKK
ncbi:hypothetical protein PFISCL1PPCAC_18461, partial [Pristionchus fissidentatus]